jgi:peroxiredoxin
MKFKSFAAWAVVAAVYLAWSAPAWAAVTDEPDGPEAGLEKLVGQIREKLTAGQNTEKDLEAELKGFDVLMEKYKDQKTDEVAQILFMKAMLYFEVLKDPDQTKVLVTRLKQDFPDTKQGKTADDILEAIKGQRQTMEIQKKLAVGATFPDFEVQDTAGEALSIARFKGKVVLLDFWATWCGPCIQELPNVLETYENHHKNGFEIIGISLDKDEEALTKFVKSKSMTWPQYYDGKGWQNELAQKYGVRSIPATYLIDGEGKIVAKNLRGPALETAVANALKKDEK